MFSDPTSRLYWPLLLVSGFFAWCWVRKEFSIKKVIDAFWHRDSLVDVSLLTTNMFIKGALFSLFTVTASALAIPLVMSFHKIFPHYPGLSLAPTTAKLTLTVFVLVVDDFLRFTHHYLMHKGLWSVHSVHHSAKKLTPLTLFRTHPLESVMAHLRSILTHALTITVMVIFFKDQMGVYDFLGVNLFGFISNATLANLRHSSIPISFGVFEYIFISPRMHQIHHSSHPKHFDKNFGVIFSLWDQLMGSFYKPKASEMSSIQYGLGAANLDLRQGIANITPALTNANPTMS